MCGIFGVASQFSLSANDQKFVKDCSIAGQLRGMDGTGYVFLEPKGTTFWKTGSNGSAAFEYELDVSKEMGNQVTVCYGHNRAATVGSVSKDTAHPFAEGSVVGVHNGTLNKGWEHRLQVSKKVKVDSQGLYRAMASRGHKWAIEKAMGAMALVWTDCTSKRTFVYRNTQRTLFFAKSLYGKKVYFASEEGMLVWLADRNKIQLAVEGPQPFKPYTLYEITGGEVIELGQINAPAKTGGNTSYSKNGGSSCHPGGAPSPQTTGTKGTQTSIPTSSTSYGTSSPPTRTPTGTPPLGNGSTSPTPLKQRAAAFLADQSLPARPHKDCGLGFYGEGVPPIYKKNGVIGEYVERGTTMYQCLCCDAPIQGSFFEETTSVTNAPKIHLGCLDEYRENFPDQELRFIRRNTADMRKTA